MEGINIIKLEDILLATCPLNDEQKIMEKHFRESAAYRTDEHIKKYINLPTSFNGRYINSDLFKETFDEYTKSFEARIIYSPVVHCSAACLANEFFKIKIQDPKMQKCIIVTGIPGAGKSFTIQSLFKEKDLDKDTIVYEGSIIDLPTIKEKLSLLIKNDKEIYILVLHPTLELSLKNTIRRFEDSGRGASTSILARIRSDIYKSLIDLHKIYKDRINLIIHEKKDNFNDPTEYYGFENIAILKDKPYNDVKEYLDNIIENMYEKGEIDGKCYYQATRKTDQLKGTIEKNN